MLDFTNIAWADGPTLSWSENEQQTAGTLTITYQIVDGNMTQSHSESLTLNGNYAQNGFTVLSDPTGGTEVVYGVRQTWTGGTSDQWNTASNWSNGVVPGATDTAIIDNVGHQPVTVGDTEQRRQPASSTRTRPSSSSTAATSGCRMCSTMPG